MENQNCEIVYQQESRNYGIDLLRIVSMLMVCILHVLGQGGVLSNTDKGTLNYNIAWILEISVYCAVNCYALISGFVGVKAKFKLSNIFYLWLQVAFFSGFITLGFAIFQGGIGGKELLFAFLPVFSKKYWYFTAYFGLFFLMPFFNIAINNINKHLLTACLIFLAVLFCAYSLFRDNFSINGGYSLLWLAYLYILGGYIYKYKPLKNIKTHNLVVCIFICILITWLPRFILETINSENNLILKIYNYKDLLISYISPTIVLIGLIYLELFSRIKFNRIPKIIIFLSPISFGVYLIHVQRNIWALLDGAFSNYATYNPFLMVLAVLGTSVAIYIICSLIDYMRLLLFKILKIKPILEKAENKLKNKSFKGEINV